MPLECRKKKLNCSWLIVCFAISPLLFFAQKQPYSFHHLTTDNGLSQASNDFLYHDSQGFVWLSSIDGLNRFDGKEVKIYKSISGDSTSLLGNIITSNFFEDEFTNIWFTTYEGLHCYIRAKDHFKHFQLKGVQAEILFQDYHVFHLDNDNNLWIRGGVGDSGKLYLFNTQDYKSQIVSKIDGQRNYVVKDNNKKVIKIISTLLSNNTGIEVWDIISNKRQFYFRKNQVKFPPTFIYQANAINANEWYLATTIGLVLFNESIQSFKIFNQYGGISVGEVFSSTSINDSTLLVTTQKQGVLLFDKSYQQFLGRIPFEAEKKLGLHLEHVNQVYKDRNNNIWITSRSSGVNYNNLYKQKFKLPNAFVDQRITSIFESSRGEIFCSYGRARTAYFLERDAELLITSTNLPQSKNPQSILYFIEEESEIWAITGNYLLKWNNDRLQFEYVSDLPAYTLSIYKDKEGEIWLATFLGIFEWKNEIEKITFKPALQFQNYQKTQATAIYEDHHRQKYLALDASKLVILNADGKEIKQIEGIGYAKSFYEEGRFLWVATTTGILKINTNDLTVEILNEQNGGLPNETYYSIIPDEQNNFWLSSNKGIVRYNRNTKTYHRYTLADGLQGNEYNTNAFLKTQTGEIWMGGTNGLNRFVPEKVKSKIPLAKIQFTRLQINDESAPDSINIEVIEGLKLAYKDNTLSFDFVGIDYSDPENVQLNYQMLGNDDDWIDAGNDGFARYSNLPFGNYTFQVKAANSDGVWSEEIKQLKIQIKRPWYRTWWFYLASVLSISGLIYGIFTYRLRQALKIERMRVKISSDLHDDVGGLLSGLAMQSELLEITAAEERKPKLQRISELSRSAMSRMRDTVWAIDARKDKLENLLDRIREHAAETLTPNDITFDLQVDDLALNKNMPINIRQNFYLICKEAITNAAKHTNGNRVKIQFKKYGRNGMELTIYDNGKVLEKNHKTTGLGMSNMQMRAEQIGGRLEVNVEEGFLIKLIL